MKKLLKILAILVITAPTVITTTACNSKKNSDDTPDDPDTHGLDVLSLAEKKMGELVQDFFNTGQNILQNNIPGFKDVAVKILDDLEKLSIKAWDSKDQAAIELSNDNFSFLNRLTSVIIQTKLNAKLTQWNSDIKNSISAFDSADYKIVDINQPTAIKFSALPVDVEGIDRTYNQLSLGIISFNATFNFIYKDFSNPNNPIPYNDSTTLTFSYVITNNPTQYKDAVNNISRKITDDINTVFKPATLDIANLDNKSQFEKGAFDNLINSLNLDYSSNSNAIQDIYLKTLSNIFDNDTAIDKNEFKFKKGEGIDTVSLTNSNNLALNNSHGGNTPADSDTPYAWYDPKTRNYKTSYDFNTMFLLKRGITPQKIDNKYYYVLGDAKLTYGVVTYYGIPIITPANQKLIIEANKANDLINEFGNLMVTFFNFYQMTFDYDRKVLVHYNFPVFHFSQNEDLNKWNVKYTDFIKKIKENFIKQLPDDKKKSFANMINYFNIVNTTDTTKANQNSWSITKDASGNPIKMEMWKGLISLLNNSDFVFTLANPETPKINDSTIHYTAWSYWNYGLTLVKDSI